MSRNFILAGRLALCQLFGTFAGLLLVTVLGTIWRAPVSLSGDYLLGFGIVFFGGLAIGLQFYFVVLVILIYAWRLILRRPLVWCVGIPAALLTCALIAFPPSRYQGIIWIALIPLCGLLSGALFYLWLRVRPLTA